MSTLMRKRMATRASGSRKRAKVSFASAVRSLKETKYLNTPMSLTGPGLSTETILNDVPAGNGTSNRDGRKILVTGLEARFRIKDPSTSEGGNADTRVIIYVPKDPNARISIGFIGQAVENNDFWILYDQIHQSKTVGAAGGVGTATCCVNIRKLLKLTTEFNGLDGGDFTRNPIIMKTVTDGVAPDLNVTGHTKCWYKDM